VTIEVVEGTRVNKGQKIANVTDEKLTLQIRAIDASLSSLQSQLENARAELKRGENLLQRGVTTVQRLDGLRTEKEIIEGRIGTVEAERDVLKQREAEGTVLAPISGTVLNVPVTEGSVVLPGEAIAEIGGGGFFLRLAVPERHAGFLSEGSEIRVAVADGEAIGTLAKIYPLIENGRVIADVEVEGMSHDFVDARVLVRLPVGKTEAIVVPVEAVVSHMGLDFVSVAGIDGTPIRRTVVVGAKHNIGDVEFSEILSGLKAGENLVIGHE
jgi:RND family efflux transporter MFP subunit